MVEYGLKVMRQLAHVYSDELVDMGGLSENHVEEAIARLAILRVETVLRYSGRCRASLTEDERLQAVRDAVECIGQWL